MHLLFVLLLLFLCQDIDFFSQGGIDFGTRQLFQDFGFFFRLALQEFGEIALCQQGGTAELLEGKSDGGGLFGIDFQTLGICGLCTAVFPGPFDILNGGIGLLAGTAYVPAGSVWNFVGPDKIKFYPGFSRVTAHQLPFVVDGYTVLAFGKSMVGIAVVLIGRLAHSGGIVVECQADGIEDGGLAGSCFSTDKENSFSRQGFLFEIDDCVFDGGQVVYGKFL